MLFLIITLFFVKCSHVQCEVINDPTLKPGSLVIAGDAQVLKKELKETALESIDRDKIAKIIFHRTFDERKQLEKYYDDNYCKHTNRYGQTYYVNTLKLALEEISIDSLDKLYSISFTPFEGILAKAVCDGINNPDESSDQGLVVEEVICAEDNAMKKRIKDFYLPNYGSTLEQHLATYNKDDALYQEAILRYCLPDRAPELKINEQVATDEANSLRQIDPEKDKENFKNKLKEFLGKYTEADLKLIFQKYRKDDKNGIDKTVRDVFEGNERRVYSILVAYIENTCKYYADALHDSMDGFGTDISRINRIVLTRCERDLACIHKEYKRLHDETYTERLDDDTTEDRYLESIRYLSGKP